MGNSLRRLTKEESRREFRRGVIGDFIKYYNMLTDEEAFAVQKIVIEAKDRFFNKEEKEDGYKEKHRDV